MTADGFNPLDGSAGLADGDAYQEIECGRVCKPSPPLFTIGTLPDYLGAEFLADSPTPDIGCYTLQNVRVTFDGFISRAGRLFTGPALNHPPDHIAAAIAHHAPNWPSFLARRIRGEAVLLHGPGSNVYGHWLIDFLPRLWVLRRCGRDIHRLRYILPHRVPGFGLAMLESWGISQDRLILYDESCEALEVETLLAPSLLRRGNRVSPLLSAAVAYWRSLAPAREAVRVFVPQNHKIFVTRKHHHTGGRHLLCRGEIEEAARQAGYMLLHPEDWSVTQQMRIFAAATHIAGEYGSGMHNSIFAPPGARICVLRGTSFHPGFAQSGLAEACGHELAYLFGPTPADATDQILAISPADFKTALARLDHPLGQPEDKSLFASFSSEKEDSVLFLKKKNQKDFYVSAA